MEKCVVAVSGRYLICSLSFGHFIHGGNEGSNNKATRRTYLHRVKVGECVMMGMMVGE